MNDEEHSFSKKWARKNTGTSAPAPSETHSGDPSSPESPLPYLRELFAQLKAAKAKEKVRDAAQLSVHMALFDMVEKNQGDLA